MTQYIILSRVDMEILLNNDPLTIYIDGEKFTLCTDECFEKERNSNE